MVKIKYHREVVGGSESARKFGFKKYQTIKDQEKSERGSNFQRAKSFISPKKYYGRKVISSAKKKGKSVALVKVFSKIAPSRKSKMMGNGNQSAQDYLFG